MMIIITKNIIQKKNRVIKEYLKKINTQKF